MFCLHFPPNDDNKYFSCFIGKYSRLSSPACVLCLHPPCCTAAMQLFQAMRRRDPLLGLSRVLHTADESNVCGEEGRKPGHMHFYTHRRDVSQMLRMNYFLYCYNCILCCSDLIHSYITFFVELNNFFRGAYGIWKHQKKGCLMFYNYAEGYPERV